MFLFSVVSQIYTVNLLEESVLRGNAAIFKCHISTFVTEYVSVSSWIISEGDINELEIKAESNDLGTLIFHRFCCNYYFPFFSFSCPDSLQTVLTVHVCLVTTFSGFSSVHH